MCGLVGIMSSNMLIKHKDALASLLYLDTWRGRDATGVAALRQNADTAILKATVPGYDFVDQPKFEHHLKLNDFLWIGHNRFGTMGKNIKTNAHPFTVEDEQGTCLLVGAHNGTLTNKHVLSDSHLFGTDSEALFNNIAKEGVDNTLSKVEGAWALTYYDHVTEEFCVVRNKERPLHYAFSEDNKTLLWASESWMLKVVCSRHDIKLKDNKIFVFEEDTLYSVSVPLKLNEELVMKSRGGVAGKPPVFFRTANQNRYQFDRIGGTGGASQSQAETQTPKSTKNTQLTSNVSPIDSGKKYKGYKGELLSLRQLKDQLQDGCQWCQDVEITPDDKGYGWLASEYPICSKCISGEHKQQEMVDALFNHLDDKSVVFN